LKEFKNWLKCKGLLGCAIAMVIASPEFVEAAEENGVAGVTDHALGEGINAVEGTLIAGGVGATVIGSTAIAGGTLTVGGTTLVSGGTIAAGIGTVTTVGGAVIAASAGGYAVGTAIASTKPGKWVTTNVGEGMAWVCPRCFTW
jgi:hypothetical protein